MQKVLTEPEKYLEALLRNDRLLQRQEQTRQLLNERMLSLARGRSGQDFERIGLNSSSTDWVSCKSKSF